MIREFLTGLTRTRKSELEAYWMELNRAGIQGAPSLDEARRDFVKTFNQMVSRTI